MILATSASPSPLPDGFRCDERLEQMRADVVRNAGTVVADDDQQRHIEPRRGARHGQAHAVLEPGHQGDLRIGLLLLRRRLGGVLHQVEDHLHELVAIAPDRRQRRVVDLLEPHMRREARLRQLAHVLQHAMDVHRGPRDRLLAEDLHPIDQGADAIRLVADQYRQLAVLRIDAGLQQLCRTANAGERVLHLMREDRRHTGDAARRAAEGELTVQRAGGRSILQHQQHRARLLRQR